MKRYFLNFVWFSHKRLTKNNNSKQRPKCGAWRLNGVRLGDVMEAGRRFRGAWSSFCKSGGSEVIFAGIMAPLHPLPTSTHSLKKKG